MEKRRSESAGIPISLTMVDKNRVNMVKLAIKPNTTPMGLFLPPTWADERIMGRRGKIQGDKIVTIPAKKAKIIRRSIVMFPGITTTFIVVDN